MDVTILNRERAATNKKSEIESAGICAPGDYAIVAE
jgi:hypothetical protein